MKTKKSKKPTVSKVKEPPKPPDFNIVNVGAKSTVTPLTQRGRNFIKDLVYRDSGYQWDADQFFTTIAHAKYLTEEAKKEGLTI
jgi:hypothetical protein